MKGKEISSLYRSYSPRMSHYESDGQGRDLYIKNNNGGFWTQGVKIPVQSSLANISDKYRVRITAKNIPPFKYNSDGSGRDSYVIFNSGGLKNDFKSLNEFHLKDTLRTPDSCIYEFKNNPTKDGVRTRTVYVSKQEYEVNRYLKNNESGIIKRLYTNEKHKFIKPIDELKRDKNNLANLYNPGDNDEQVVTLPIINSQKSSRTNLPDFIGQAVYKINNYEYKKNIFKKMTDELCHIKYKTTK